MQDPESDDEEEELGMAARSILQSVPKHRLKQLEVLQADAEEENAATKVLFPISLLLPLDDVL